MSILIWWLIIGCVGTLILGGVLSSRDDSLKNRTSRMCIGLGFPHYEKNAIIACYILLLVIAGQLFLCSFLWAQVKLPFKKLKKQLKLNTLKNKLKKKFPQLTKKQIRQKIKATSKDLSLYLKNLKKQKRQLEEENIIKKLKNLIPNN